MRYQLLHVAALAIGAATLPAWAADTTPSPAAAIGWVLQLPRDDKLTYQGVVNGSVSGGTNSMLYLGGHPLLLLVGMLTHAAIESSSQKTQRDGLQRSADRVLQPYRPILDNFGHRELVQRTLPLTAAPAGASLVEHDQVPPQGQWVIQGVPVFSLTQDAQALLLDHAIEVRAAAAPAEPLYRNVIRVVSLPQPEGDRTAAWSEDEGRPLKEQSASLLATSLDIALAAAASNAGGVPVDDKPFRTVRYTEGGQEKMERAQVLDERCGRLLLKNLRGWLMSVPARAPAAADNGCMPAAAPQPAAPASAAN